ncbi:HNH endonuclease [Lachnospiraceae bacterium SGI.066]
MQFFTETDYDLMDLIAYAHTKEQAILKEDGKYEIFEAYAHGGFCELCFERGLAVPVEEIHHKKPLSEGGTHDRSNLIALCMSCHSQIHAKRGDRWHNH